MDEVKETLAKFLAIVFMAAVVMVLIIGTLWAFKAVLF